MILILFILGLILGIISIPIKSKYNWDSIYELKHDRWSGERDKTVIKYKRLSVFGTLSIIISIIFICTSITIGSILIYKIIYNGDNNEKIEIIYKENNLLEEKLVNSVKDYLEQEKIYKEFKSNEEYINIIVNYPKLYSKDLIQDELNTYKRNTEEIKSLELELINVKNHKFLLYFGR